MIENMHWSATGERRNLSAEFPNEPSHIHLPRRRRFVRPDDRTAGAPWRAPESDEAHRSQPQPVTQDA